MQAMAKNKIKSMTTAKYIIGLILILFLGYHSVYFEKLDVVKAATDAKTFDPKGYARSFWDEKLLPNLDQAVSLFELVSQLKSEPEKAFEAHSHALGVGNIRYFLIRGEAKIIEVKEDELLIQLEVDSMITSRLATEFIFGNAVRDASGLININEFTNTMDFNQVSAEINEIIRNEVVPEFKKQVQVGDLISFVGAIELNQERLNLEEIEIIPIQIQSSPPNPLP